MAEPPRPGTVGWIDLTVPEAGALKDFYADVVGWSTSAVDLGGYSDFCVHPGEGQDPVAGICHARGANEGLPPVWLIYFVVADLEASVARARERGATLLRPPTALGAQGSYAVIRDPAGACAALYQAGD